MFEESDYTVKTSSHSPGETDDGSVIVLIVEISRERAKGTSEYCEKSGGPAPVGYAGSKTLERTYVRRKHRFRVFFLSDLKIFRKKGPVIKTMTMTTAFAARKVFYREQG